jgi:outer membrane protein
MKKLFIIAFAVLGLGISQVQAQSKFGYVNATEMLYLMPDMKKVELALDSIEQDLAIQYQQQMDEYNALIKKYDEQAKNGASQAMLQLTQDEVVKKQEHLQKVQTAFQEAIVEEQTRLLTPLNDKIMKAIKEVAAEKGLNYVFDISKGAVLHWDEKDNVDKDVRKKLGIAEDAKLPTNGGK